MNFVSEGEREGNAEGDWEEGVKNTKDDWKIHSEIAHS